MISFVSNIIQNKYVQWVLHCLLFLIFVFHFATAEAEDKTLNEYWMDAGLSFQYLKDFHVNRRVCAKSQSVTPEIFYGCIHGLNLGAAAADSRFNKVRVFAPKGFRRPSSKLVKALGQDEDRLQN